MASTCQPARRRFYLAAVGVFDGSLPEEEVDEIALGHRAHKIRSCQISAKRRQKGKLIK